MTPEGKVVAAAKKAAKDCGVVFIRLSFGRGVATGWPDIEILGPGGRSLWMECKRRGKDATPMQLERKRILEAYGHMWVKPDTPEQAREHVIAFARWCLKEEGVDIYDA